MVPQALQRGLKQVFYREPWWAEFWSAITALLWAGMTYASLEELRYWPSMQMLVTIGNDRFWHLLGFGLGISQIVFLLWDQRWLRWGTALAQGWFWGLLTLGVWIATPWSPAVAVYAGWCGLNVYSVLRLMRPDPIAARRSP